MSVSPSIRLLTCQRTRVLVAFALGTLVFFTFQSTIRLHHGKGNANSLRVNNASIIDQSSDDGPQVLVVKADHFFWLNNGPKAAPFYARAEKLFADKGDTRDEIYARVGRLRSEADTMSFDNVSRLLT